MKNIGKKIISVICCLILLICGGFSVCKAIPQIGGIFENKSLNFAGKLSGVKNELEQDCKENHPFINYFYYLYGKTISVLGQREVVDSELNVYKLKNGWLTHMQKDVSPKDYAREIDDFNNFLTSQGIPNVYVITAMSGDERTGQLPLGVTHNYKERTKELTDILDANGIGYLDGYKLLANSGDEYFSYFYKTDHHWNDKAGIFIAGEITNYLNLKFQYNLDASIYNLDNYDLKTYKKIFLGSLGRKTSAGYVSPENFDIYLPKYETSFVVSADNLHTEGDYFTAFINKSLLENVKKYSHLCYDAFLYSNHPLMTIENRLCNNGKRLLVIKDSKANVVDAHLASSVQYLDIIDPRYMKSGIRDYIKNTNPDVVLSIFAIDQTSEYYDLH